MTFTRDDRTLLGDDPEKVVRSLVEDGADIIGINCSGGPAQMLRILKMMCQAVPEVRFSVMPNAGWPEQVGGRIMYPAAADYFGDYADAFRQNGAVVSWVAAAAQLRGILLRCARRSIDTAGCSTWRAMPSGGRSKVKNASRYRKRPARWRTS